jgi:DNA-binding response OmpR family regulator
MAGERILIVEDERAVARGLEYGLNKEGFQTLWAADGEHALELARTRDPHLILLDVRLPDISGFDVCRILRQEGRRMPILMLTARDEELDKVLGLELGADDYVVKPYRLRELIARLRALLRRAYGDLAGATGTDRLVFGNLELDLESLQVTKDGKAVPLTATEFRLLHYLASHPERIFSRSALIEAVWGYDSSVGYDRTVDVHIRHLREKLEDDPSNPRWIVTVRGLGYKFQR